MTPFTITEYRQLQEALEWWDEDKSIINWRWDSRVWGLVDSAMDAARRWLDRYQICDNPGCDGGESVEWRGPLGYEGLMPINCPKCGGSGLLPNQERLEAAVQAQAEAEGFISPFDDAWDSMRAAVRTFDKDPETAASDTPETPR